MNLHTKRKVSLLYLVKGQLIYFYLSNHGWQNHRRVRSDTLSGRLLQVIRLNQESILVEIVRPPIWQLRGSPGTRGLNNTHNSNVISLSLFLVGHSSSSPKHWLAQDYAISKASIGARHHHLQSVIWHKVLLCKSHVTLSAWP